MKKNLLNTIVGGILVMATLMVSCSKHSNDVTPTLSQLLVVPPYWNMTKLEFQDKTSGNWISEPIDNYWGSYPDFTTVSFSADGKMTVSGPNESASGTWSVSGSTLTATPRDEDPQVSTISTLNSTTFVTYWSMPEQDFTTQSGTVKAIGVRETFTAGNTAVVVNSIGNKPTTNWHNYFHPAKSKN